MNDANDFEGRGSPSFVYRELKSRIINLRYQVGERLSEARLVEDLGVGRSPIRMALARLKLEGWVAISPQSGTYIRAMSLREIREVANLRVLLEKQSAGAAATRMSDGVLRSIRKDFDACRAHIIEGSADAFIEFDNKFHEAVYDAADNALIQRILFDLRDKVQWIRRVCSISNERVQEGFSELEVVLNALERRDELAAAHAMESHVESAAAFCERLEKIGAGAFAVDRNSIRTAQGM